jgi:hypothetical protein
MAYTKGTGPVSAAFAKGGPEITTKSRFMKTPNQFTTGRGVKKDFDKVGKGGTLSKLEGDTKSEKPIKPRT